MVCIPLCVMPLNIEIFELPPIGTNCYAVTHPDSDAVAVFDAPMEAWSSIDAFRRSRGLKLGGLYFTHGHWDHTLDGAKFRDAGALVFAHAGDRLFYEAPDIMASYSIPGMEMPPVQVTNWLEHGQRIDIIGRPVEVRHVPGHSQGSILFWFVEDKVAISGDALFQGSIGRTDFPGCSFEQLSASIKTQIYTLPDDTVVYPGHGPKTSVADEAMDNPFVRG